MEKCKYRIKQGKCPYKELKRQEENLKQIREIIEGIEVKSKQLEDLLSCWPPKVLPRLDDTFMDGLGQQYLGTWRENKVCRMEAVCPYKEKDCQMMVQWQQGRIKSMYRKLYKVSSTYNKALYLWQQCKNNQSSHQGKMEDLWVDFKNEEVPYLVSFDEAQLKSKKEATYILTVFWGSGDFTCETYRLTFRYEANSSLLKGSRYQGKAPLQLLILSPLAEEFPFTWGQLEASLIKLINRWHKIGACRVGAVVFTLPTGVGARKKLLREFGALGYQTLGVVDEKKGYEQEAFCLKWV